MKKSICLVSILTLFFLLFIASVNVAKAQWSAIKESGPAKNAGYAVTTNWHGVDVPIGQTVVATAGTTDLSVTKIEFIWRDPSNRTIWVESLNVSKLTTPDVPPNVPDEVIKWANQNQGITYLYAQSVHNPNATGDWGIQAIFYNATKPVGNKNDNFVVRRATSINVIPDAPVLGTAGLLSSMAISLGLFKFKHKKE